MRIDIRIPLLILVCLGPSWRAGSAQRQGEILERQAAQSRTVGAGNATQGMQAPVLGFVYDPNHGEVRAILGIAGASVLGGPMAVPAGVTGVNFAPSRNYALLARRGGGFIGLLTFQGAEEGSLIPICGAISQPDLISFSPSGNTAALYSTAAGQLQVISGLPQSPKLARIIGRDDLPDDVRFLAVADDGVTLLQGTVHSAVYLLPEGGSARLLYRAGDLGGMAFTPRSSDVVVFDREAGTAFLLQGVNNAGAYVLLAEGLTGVGGSALVQVNSRSAVITGTNSNNLWRIDLQTLQVQNVSLPVTPRLLQPLQTSGKYLLLYQSGLPAWIVDTSGEAGAVSFVPASLQPHIRPKPIPLSTSAGLLVGPYGRPDLVNRPTFGPGCTDQ